MLNMSYMTKRSLARAIAVFAAVLVACHYALSEFFWLPITTVLVMQTAIGVVVRQGVERFLLIVLGVSLGTFFVKELQQSVLVDVLITFVFSLSCYFAAKDSRSYMVFTAPFLIGVVILLAMLLPASHHNIIQARL